MDLYSVYNADSQGLTSLKTSLYGVYNGESNTNDSYGTNNGTAIGGLTYTNGKIGQAFNFNGSNSYVQLPNNSMNFTGDFSISCWVKSNTSGNYIIFNNYIYSGGLDYGYGLSIRGNDLYFQIMAGNSIVNLIYTNSSGWTSQFNHILVKRTNNSGSELYLNGTKVAFNSSTTNPSYTSTHTPTIGVAKDPVLYWYFNGIIDAVSVWNKALTASEITDLYNSGNGSQYITDTFYKPTTNDALGTNNGTAVGGLTYTTGKIGQAFSMNGSTSYVSLPNNSLNFTGDFSYSMFVYFKNIPSGEAYMLTATNGNGSNINYGTSFGIISGVVHFTVFNGGSYSSWKTNLLLPTTWYHLVMTKTVGNAPKFYINGTLTPTTLVAGTNSMNPVYTGGSYPNSLCSIGNYRYNNGSSSYAYANANIDAVNTWQKELTQAEVTELYNSGNAKQYPF